MEDKQRIIDELKKYGQDHIIAYLNRLDIALQEKLLSQLKSIDFELLNNLYALTKEPSKNIEEISPIQSVDKELLSEKQIAEYKACGENEMFCNRYAVITMAGGQGTRLGYDGPKGTYILDTKMGKVSFFELIAMQFVNMYKKHGLKIHWYIMTSSDNDLATKEFFKNNMYFGYFEEYVHFFVQGELPMLDMSGKIIMETPSSIKIAGDGNGSVFKSLKKSKLLDYMKLYGIRWVGIFGIDNILAKQIDPFFLGMAVQDKKMVVAKSVMKEYSTQKVGVFCRKNNKLGIVEYTELPAKASEEVKNNGELLYSDAFIVSSIFHIDVIDKILKQNLPYHIALKKCDMIENGVSVVAKQPNAYKFETYIFDAFEFEENMSIIRVKKEDEFAPVKNKEGADSVDTAVQLFNDFTERNR